MKFKQKYILIVSALVFSQFCYGQQKFGQNRKQVQEKCLYHFEDLQSKQTWTNSYNAAGLNFIDFKSSSFIEAYYGKANGALVNYNESDNSYNFGLRTSSYKKINKTTFFGKIDYNNFTGQNMTNSGLIHPERYMLTVADDRPAEKIEESYKLSGGISTPLTKKLFIGMLLNYETSMLAKRKDLRHRTDMLDFEVTGGLVYKLGSINIGANYYYRKFYEKVAFSKVAEDDIIYNGYLYKGLWFGVFDKWNLETISLSRPFTDAINGGSLQIEFAKDKFKLFNEFTYKRQTGYTGDTESKALSQSEANIYEYSGKLQYEKPNLRQYLNLRTSYKDATAYDNVVTSENIGGIYVPIYYGKNKEFTKRNFDLNTEYNVAFGKHKCNPSVDIKVGYHYMSQAAMSSLTIPYYFTQEIKVNTGYIKVKKNYFWSKGMIDISLMGAYSKGTGNKLDSSIPLQTIVQSTTMLPDQNETMLNREYEFLTTGKFNGEIGMRYSKFVRVTKKPSSVYIDAKYSFVKAKDLKYIAKNSSGIFSLAVGYAF